MSETARRPPSTPAACLASSPGCWYAMATPAHPTHKPPTPSGSHLLRDLRSISDADPDGQLWATAMATTLTDANRAAHAARERGAEALDEATLKQIRNHYRGALARGDIDNQGEHTSLADKARTLLHMLRR